MKRFVEGEDRRQGALLPHCLDDYVTENNPVRVIEAFIDELDLATLGFDGVVPETTGRPAYHPATLLKIYLYGYLNRIPSSRLGVDLTVVVEQQPQRAAVRLGCPHCRPPAWACQPQPKLRGTSAFCTTQKGAPPGSSSTTKSSPARYPQGYRRAPEATNRSTSACW